MTNFFPFIGLFGAGLAALLAAGQWIKASQDALPERSVRLSLLLICVAIWQWGLTFWHLKTDLHEPFLFLLTLPAMGLSAPLLYDVLMTLTHRQDHIKLSLKHYIPAALILPFVWLWPFPSDISLGYFMMNALFALYCFAILNQLKFMIKNKHNTHPQMKHFFALIALAGMAIIFEAFDWVLTTPILGQLSDVAVTCTLVYLYLIDKRYPGFSDLVYQESVKKRYQHTKHTDVEVLQNKLERLMNVDKRYQDHDLKLSILAADLEVSGHLLSQYLNDNLNSSFSQYVNHFRIEEAMLLLRSKPEINVLAISIEVGFKSTSAFHAAFKKMNGCSPGDYRKKKGVEWVD